MIDELEKLLEMIDAHKGPWGTVGGDEKNKKGYTQMPYWIESDIVNEARDYFYKNGLMVNFDWPAWDEGREFFKNEDPEKYDKLDKEWVCKLLTAVVRNDRFFDGAWVGLFESGDAQKLFRRLLEIEKGNI